MEHEKRKNGTLGTGELVRGQGYFSVLLLLGIPCLSSLHLQTRVRQQVNLALRFPCAHFQQLEIPGIYLS